jgi:hypothetical protein
MDPVVIHQPDDTPEFRHAGDFRSVWFRDATYTFTPKQAAAVKYLCEASTNLTPDVSQHYLLVEIGSESKTLRDLFRLRGQDGRKRVHPAWGRLIVPGERKGTFRLAPPAKSPGRPPG